MRVWTAQPLGFDLCGGLFDRAKSDSCGARTLPNHKEAYAFLHKALGTDRLVWCYPYRPEDGVGASKRLWQINVPEHHFSHLKPLNGAWTVAAVDGAAWNKMCGSTRLGPDTFTMRKLKQKCRLASDDVFEQRRLVKEELWRLQDPEPFEDLCERLFIADPAAIFANILLRHPIPQEWIGPQDTQA